MAHQQAEDRSTKTVNDHGAHVAAWKKDEVHEIPKNNYPVGKSLISQFFFPLAIWSENLTWHQRSVLTGLFMAVFLAALGMCKLNLTILRGH